MLHRKCVFSAVVFTCLTCWLDGKEIEAQRIQKTRLTKGGKALNGGAIIVISECDRNRLLFARGILKMNETVFARRTVYFERCKYFANGWRVWDNMNLDWPTIPSHLQPPIPLPLITLSTFRVQNNHSASDPGHNSLRHVAHLIAYLTF